MTTCALRGGASSAAGPALLPGLHAPVAVHVFALALTLLYDHSVAWRLPCSIQRDVAVRGRDVEGVIEQYTRFVKPAFDQFVAPSRKYADVIIPWQRCDEA